MIERTCQTNGEYGIMIRDNLPADAGIQRGAMDKEFLYISDLDGTLMRNDGTISAYTVRVINELVAKGIAFTYATARSVESARTITGGLKLELPVITRNGCVLADNGTGKHLEKAVFTDEEVALLKRMLPELPEYGFVSCFTGEEMIKTYLPGKHTHGLQKYLDYYEQDPRMRAVENFDGLFCGKPGYVTLIDDKEKIAPIYERVRRYPGWECVFQKDTYWDEYWVEICPQNCTKARAALKMKERYGFRKLAVFGDSINDLSMFRAADESYAVANALDEVKTAATAVIGSNEEDAVANLLKQRADRNA